MLNEALTPEQIRQRKQAIRAELLGMEQVNSPRGDELHEQFMGLRRLCQHATMIEIAGSWLCLDCEKWCASENEPPEEYTESVCQLELFECED